MRLLVDCDPGNGAVTADIDDGLALALAWATPGVDLQLITIVNGNVAAELGGVIAAGLAELAQSGVTIVISEEQPAAEPSARWRSLIDERSRGEEVAEYWRETSPHLGTRPSPLDAAEHLARAIRDDDEPATLLALGPLTTVAAAERRRPGLLASCASVVVLGGAFAGATGVRELNFALDPEAADVVLSSGANLTLVPLDISRTSWITLEDIEVLARSRQPLLRHLGVSSRAWIRWISETRNWPGANAHDLLAAAIALEPSIATYESATVRVELEPGPDRSRPVRDSALGRSNAQPISVVTGFDADRFRELYLHRFASPNQTVPTPKGAHP